MFYIRFIKILCFGFILAAVISLPSLAENTGSCGENCTWNLENGVLTISGTGEMANYSRYTSPWFNYKDNITSVFVNDGITSIGDWSFYDLAATNVNIANTVQSIGYASLYHMGGVKNLIIPDSVQSIGGYAFEAMSKLESIFLSNPNITYGPYPFYGTSGVNTFCPGNSTCQTATNVSWYTAVHTYMQDSETGVYTVDGNYYASADDILTANKCASNEDGAPSQKCIDDALAYKIRKAKLMAQSKVLCQTTTGCLKLLDMVQEKEKCTTIVNCNKYGQENGILFDDPNMIKNPDGSYTLYDENSQIIGFKGKRIYTVDEATLLAKPKGNTFIIRYR